MKEPTKYEVTLFPPTLKPEQFSNCVHVDTDNLRGGIMFTTQSGEYYVSTLPYKVRPEPARDRHGCAEKIAAAIRKLKE